jgi:hypothetical protein
MLIAAGTIALCIAVLRYRTVAKSLNARLREASADPEAAPVWRGRVSATPRMAPTPAA